MTTHCYQRYLRSEAWKIRRVNCLVSAGGVCQRCEGWATEVHHKNYRNLGSEDPDDLEALCAKCHAEEHGRVYDNDNNVQGDLIDLLASVKKTA